MESPNPTIQRDRGGRVGIGYNRKKGKSSQLYIQYIHTYYTSHHVTSYTVLTLDSCMTFPQAVLAVYSLSIQGVSLSPSPVYSNGLPELPPPKSDVGWADEGYVYIYILYCDRT